MSKTPPGKNSRRTAIHEKDDAAMAPDMSTGIPTPGAAAAPTGAAASPVSPVSTASPVFPVSPASPPQRAPAKGRILDTASVLFYQHGILNVGVDRIIAQSAVTKATFYKHYRSKDNLIREYVRSQVAETEARTQQIIAAAASAHDAVVNLLDDLLAQLTAEDFRGCPFLNVVAEYPDPAHPLRQMIAEHRDRDSEVLCGLMRDTGHPFSGDAADEIILAKDGALAGGYAGDAIAAGAALARIVTRVLADSVAFSR
ncbi:MAG: TetR/AcrR family transcriptional regulator [Rhodoglobus sp.]